MHPYVAQQPDELTLELADILNILDKTDDGEAQGPPLGAPRGRCTEPCPARDDGKVEKHHHWLRGWCPAMSLAP